MGNLGPMSDILVRELREGDPEAISAAFRVIGWNKPLEQYQRYLSDQRAGSRKVFVAEADGEFAGYVTVIWESGYPPFRDGQIPETQDFNVLPRFRQRGIGTQLLDAAEAYLAQRSPVIGIGVGMHSGYGAAQRLYVKRGYIPDGRGVVCHEQVVAQGAMVCNDDDLILYFTKKVR
jgi:GNAT superfamily N-acetyltransferase